ncbi:MAG: type I-F CRISPR-associated protein Csy1, partial [Burkholderiales bacterium]|nr:type I-F CRISPR-associated protein Csy1 [Burkholderiales bacterium]
ENTKQAKEDKRKNNYNANGFADIYNLTVMAYGGTQPQNISVLNSQNAGRAYLLPSIPPVLEKRNVKLPKFDFFKQCLYRKNFQESFKNLHKLMQLEINNINIRNAINKVIGFIVDDVLFTAFKIRQYESAWSMGDAYANLPIAQKIWLDNAYQNERLEQIEWRDEISQDIARWLLRTYKDLIYGALLLGDVELQKINQLITELIEQDKEFF